MTAIFGHFVLPGTVRCLVCLAAPLVLPGLSRSVRCQSLGEVVGPYPVAACSEWTLDAEWDEEGIT